MVVAGVAEYVGGQNLGRFLVDSVQPGREAECTEADAHTIGLDYDLPVTVLILVGNLDAGQERVRVCASGGWRRGPFRCRPRGRRCVYRRNALSTGSSGF